MNADTPDTTGLILKSMLQVGVFTLIPAASFFISSGRLDWAMAWVYLGVIVTSYSLITLILISTNPELVAERTRTGGKRDLDRVLAGVMALFGPAVTCIVAGLDVRFSAIGKPFTLACLALIILTPLKIGQGIFVVGLVIFTLGFIGMIVALFNFRNTPTDQPVTSGLYRVSRNPQWVTLVTMFLGTGIAIGSWTAVLLLLIAAVFYHFRIRGEERACLARYGEPYQAFLDRVPRYFVFF